MNLATINQYATTALAVLSLLVVLVPLVGNALAGLLRAAGKVDAARKLDAWIPAALGAMREARVLSEAAQKATGQGSPTGPPSGAVDVLAAVARKEMTSTQGADAIADDAKRSETSPLMQALKDAATKSMLVLCFVVALTGCGAAQQIEHVVQVSSEVIARAEPCLVAQYEAAQRDCLKEQDLTKAEACVAAVRQTFAPVAAALGELRAARCQIEPAKCGVQK